MSEQNILNASQTSTLNPDYGLKLVHQPTFTEIAAYGGPNFKRLTAGKGRVFDVQWKGRSAADRFTLGQWERQYELGYFSMADWISSRYFTGRFLSPLSFVYAGNEQYDISGQFEELMGVPLYAYPSNWSRDAVFLNGRDDFGNDLVKLTGGWSWSTRTLSHSGADYSSPGNNTTDLAEWVYFGYGFQFWSQKESDAGIAQVFLDGASQGTVDLYSAALVNSAAVLTVTNVQLGFHRVGVQATNTKNASSSNYFIFADAIQTMR